MKFPEKKGTGLRPLIPRVTKECIDLLEKLLAYSPEQRLTAKQALKHVYFRDLYEQEKAIKMQMKLAKMPSIRSFQGEQPQQ